MREKIDNKFGEKKNELKNSTKILSANDGGQKRDVCKMIEIEYFILCDGVISIVGFELLFGIGDSVRHGNYIRGLENIFELTSFVDLYHLSVEKFHSVKITHVYKAQNGGPKRIMITIVITKRLKNCWRLIVD